MNTAPTPSTGQPAADTGQGEATFVCGHCGTPRTVTSPDAYLQAVLLHHDARQLLAHLNPVERDGLASILRVILSAPELGAEFLALIDHLDQPPTPPVRPDERTEQPQERGAV